MKDLDDELFDALDRGKPFDDLLDVLRRFKQRGVSQRAVYDKLTAIWMQFGCGDEAEQSPGCTQVEDLLEIVGHHRPTKHAIWAGSLSSET
jgi:hypothetical protein